MDGIYHLVLLDSHGAPIPVGNVAGFGDGFAQLAAMDQSRDGIVDAGDAAFALLRVWVDADGDGMAGAGEVRDLASLGIAAIRVAADPASLQDHGNLIAATGTAIMADGGTRQVA